MHIFYEPVAAPCRSNSKSSVIAMVARIQLDEWWQLKPEK